MFRVLLIVFLSFVTNKGKCANTLLNSLQVSTAYRDFVQGLMQIQNKAKIIDVISDSVKDLLRYNFGLKNEDKYLNATQLLTKYGHRVEVYEVQTADGYLLTLIRVPSAGEGANAGAGRPVLLMHGLFCSVDEFITSGPRLALAYVLVDAGYDVWLGNFRGNKYSERHVSLSFNDEKFWNFSFHEMGVYDVPSLIDFILERTSFPRVYCVCHSQGCTASYVLLSERPDYNSKIALLASMAPVAWLNHLISPVLRVLVPIRNEVAIALEALRMYDVPSDGPSLDIVKEIVCGNSVTASLVCGNGMIPLVGFDVAQTNFTRFPVQLAHMPSGASIKLLLHYSQLVPRSIQFQKFDYGSKNNLRVYGSVKPPQYAVQRVSAPTALFYSPQGSDWLSVATDVTVLARHLPRLVYDHVLPEPFNHVDYYWGNDAKTLVYDKILDLFKEYQI